MRRLLLALAVLAIADQLVVHLALDDGRVLGRWVVPFQPPLFTEWQRSRLRDARAIVAGDEELRARSILDADLGWCPDPGSTLDIYEYDWAGARVGAGPLAREKPPGTRRIVTVGGSFTQGAEVNGADAWPAKVDAAEEALDVANLGIAGYGADQAFLRWRRDGVGLGADEVWLGYMPEATLRITTLFPPVYRHWSSVAAFKPRFRVGADGSLEHVPCPVSDFDDFVRLLEDQEAFLAALGETDLWVRRTPGAFRPLGSSWSHRFALPRLFTTWVESGGRDPAVWLADPQSEVYELLRALVRAFDADARERGVRFRLLVLPSRPDLRSVRSRGSRYWSGLVEELAAEGIDCLDATETLFELDADADGTLWMRNGHYGPLLNERVAELVLETWIRGTASR